MEIGPDGSWTADIAGMNYYSPFALTIYSQDGEWDSTLEERREGKSGVVSMTFECVDQP